MEFLLNLLWWMQVAARLVVFIVGIYFAYRFLRDAYEMPPQTVLKGKIDRLMRAVMALGVLALSTIIVLLVLSSSRMSTWFYIIVAFYAFLVWSRGHVPAVSHKPPRSRNFLEGPSELVEKKMRDELQVQLYRRRLMSTIYVVALGLILLYDLSLYLV